MNDDDESCGMLCVLGVLGVLIVRDGLGVLSVLCMLGVLCSPRFAPAWHIDERHDAQRGGHDE